MSPPRKGEATKKSILRHALDLSSEIGLEALSFGVLAKRAQMSKSGLYAHFETKESLQCEVLDEAAERFVEKVVSPALKEARGTPRIEALFQNWIRWERRELSGGCPFVAAAVEFDDRPGRVRRHVAAHLREMLGAVERAAAIAIDEGQFRADLDTSQFAFEFWGILLVDQQYGRLLDRDRSAIRARRAFAELQRRSAII